jgi:hypothetical protein
MSTLIRLVARYDFKSGHLADFHCVWILDEWLVENGRWDSGRNSKVALLAA